MQTARILYVVNGTTCTDEIKASKISCQRIGKTIELRFPNSDGTFVTSTQRTIPDQQTLQAMSYAQADHVVVWGSPELVTTASG